MTKKEINIVLSAGCVYSVEGLPENWGYGVTYLDEISDQEKIKLDGMIQINGTVVKDCSGLYHDG